MNSNLKLSLFEFCPEVFFQVNRDFPLLFRLYVSMQHKNGQHLLMSRDVTLAHGSEVKE